MGGAVTLSLQIPFSTAISRHTADFTALARLTASGNFRWCSSRHFRKFREQLSDVAHVCQDLERAMARTGIEDPHCRDQLVGVRLIDEGSDSPPHGFC